MYKNILGTGEYVIKFIAGTTACSFKVLLESRDLTSAVSAPTHPPIPTKL